MEFCGRSTNLRGPINRKTMEFIRRAKPENCCHFSGLDPTAGAGWINPDPAARRGALSRVKLSASRWSQRWVVTRLPPQGHADAPRKALLVDGVVTLVQR